MTRQQLIAEWTRQRDLFARLNATVAGAQLIERFLADLSDVTECEGSTPVTLAEGARLSGYSVEHLARLVRSGVISNAGRKGTPRIRVRDLPPPREFARTRTRSYDVNADARTLKNGRQ